MISSGTFTPPTSSPPFAGWARATGPSGIQTMLSLAAAPGMVSFALGLPAPELLPHAELSSATAAVLDQGPSVLQYSPPVARLKEHIVALMARRGLRCIPEQVFLTGGAQQGMSLLTHLLLEPRGRVVVEQFTYSGFRQAIEPFSPDVVELPVDVGEGIDVGALARTLQHGPRPALIYTIPQGHNPVGVSMSETTRARLVELASFYGVPVIEDDAYGLLQYGDRMMPPVRALDGEWVCYVGSFSKIVAPALRQGWLVVPEPYIAKLAVAKESADINAAPLAQRILSAHLDAGSLPRHIEAVRREYRSRRDVMLRALEDHFPAEARWRTPMAGLFVWVELPSHARAADVLHDALEREAVAFLPGHAFSAAGTCGEHCMRLNFSHSPAHLIDEGVRRLGRAVRRSLSRRH